MGSPRAAHLLGLCCGIVSGLALAGPLRAQSGTTELISVDELGEPAGTNSFSGRPRFSPDGQLVTFTSDATLAGPPGPGTRVYVRDRLAGTTQLVSVTTSGGMAACLGPAPIAANGLVASSSGSASMATLPPPGDTNGTYDVVLRELATGTSSLASWTPAGVGDAWSMLPALSPDGSCVAFVSAATNLVAGDTFIPDVYVRELGSGLIERVSVASDGTAGNFWSGVSFPDIAVSVACSLSGDGRWVAFVSAASNLVPGDFNGKADVFVHDRQTGATTRVSVGPAGAEADGTSLAPAISADGRYVAFHSHAMNLVAGGFVSNLPAVYLHDRQTGQTTMASVSTEGTRATGQAPSISADGRFIAFESTATTLVPSDMNEVSDIFRHDRVTGATIRMSIAYTGFPAQQASSEASLSPDGRAVAFRSSADLVPGTSSAFTHVYVRTSDGWSDVGGALPGGGGSPQLTASGGLQPGEPGALELLYAWPLSPAMLLVSVGSSPVPFKGGTLKAFPAVLTVPLSTSILGHVYLPYTWPAGAPSNVDLFFQCAIQDPEAVQGVALSNALHALTP